MQKIRAVLTMPVSIDYQEKLGVRYSDSGEYARTWSLVADDISTADLGAPADGVIVTMPRSRTAQFDGFYRDSQELSLDVPLESILIDVPGEVCPPVDPPADLVDQVSELTVSWARVTIYEHGVALVMAEVVADAVMDGPQSACVKALEAALVAAGEHVCARLTSTVVLPVLQRVRPRLQSSGVLTEPGQTSPSVMPLWVSRALLVGGDSSPPVSFVTAWLGDSVQQGSSEVDRLLDPDDKLSDITRWLNYAYAVAADSDDGIASGDRHSGSLELDVRQRLIRQLMPLAYCQAHYAVLDRLDNDLSRYLGYSYDEIPRPELAILQRQLAAVSARAKFVEFEHARVLKFSDRRTRQSIVAILDAWDTAELLGEPVAEKAQAVESRLQVLSEQRRERASFGTDMILLGIGVTSILSLLISLAAYGRDVASAGSAADYDSSAARIILWLSGQATDNVIIVSVLLSLIVVLAFIWSYRRGR